MFHVYGDEKYRIYSNIENPAPPSGRKTLWVVNRARILYGVTAQLAAFMFAR